MWWGCVVSEFFLMVNGVLHQPRWRCALSWCRFYWLALNVQIWWVTNTCPIHIKTHMSIAFLHTSPTDVFCSISIHTSKWLVFSNKSIWNNCVRVCEVRQYLDVTCNYIKYWYFVTITQHTSTSLLITLRFDGGWRVVGGGGFCRECPAFKILRLKFLNSF